MGCDIFSRDYNPPPPLNREMFSGSVDAGFVLVLPFYHTETLNLTVGVLMRGGAYCGIKIPLQDFALKMQGGTYV